MKRANSIALTAGLALFAPSALAQAVEELAPVEMPAETSADAKGEPEWFREFSFASDAGTEMLLTPGSEDNWGLSFGSGERWSITVDRKSRDALTEMAPLPREEFSAGAMFRLTPRFSFGGEVKVGADSLDVEELSLNGEEEVEAGIRLRSAFKF
jgi:hypothetical protein